MSSNGFRPTVFVVDDDAAVRGAIRLLLRTVGQEVEVYGSGQEFLDAYCEDRPGCLLLDRTMPMMSGLEVQYRLNERYSILPIIFMAAFSDMSIVVTAMGAGAVNFIEKPFRDQVLFDAIRDALDKDRANRQALSNRPGILERLASLSERERDVIDRVAQGYSNELIAQELRISRRALDIQRARAMQKMGVSSDTLLARMMRRAGEGGDT